MQEKNGENVPICVGIIIISIIVYFLPRVFWSVLGHDWWFKDFKGGWIRPCHSLQRSTAHTHTMETHSMEKVPSMENFSINQTE